MMEIRILEEVPVGIVLCVVCGYGIDVDGNKVMKAVVERKKHDPRVVPRFSFIEQHVYYADPRHFESQIKAAVEKAEAVLEEVKKKLRGEVNEC